LNKPKAPPPPPPSTTASSKTLPGKVVKVTDEPSVPAPALPATAPRKLPSIDAELKSKLAEKKDHGQIKAKPRDQPISGSGQSQNKDEKEEFLVDVSSPCRIVSLFIHTKSSTFRIYF